jgi:hypothetical protein
MSRSLRPLPLRGLAALAGLLVALVPAAGADAAAHRPRLAVTSGVFGLAPHFAFSRHDYAIRCNGRSAHVAVTGAPRWQAKVSTGRYRRGSFTARRAIGIGDALTIALRRGRQGHVHRYHLRCLPLDFPAYTFHRRHAGGPHLFAMQLPDQYAAIFDRHGVPVWWYKASGEPDNVEVLPDGTVAFDPVPHSIDQTGDYEIRRLNGRLVSVVRAQGGARVDVHELLLLPNGHYLLGRQVVYGPVDASPYGGSAAADAIGIEVQEITTGGHVVWKWDSRDHIALSETAAHWWPGTILPHPPYDIVHWNAVEPDGRLMLMSFRHLDAVYAVSKRTGRVVWKLGGTHTAQSLRVVGDPDGADPLAGQHDIRVLPDGTITIHDNGSGVRPHPRVVRYRINRKTRTAHFVQAFSDPTTVPSICCGSARRLDSGDWLVGWGGQGFVGGYGPKGRRLFSLRTPDGFPYRANPVPDGAVTTRGLRRAMAAMQRRAKK